MVQAILLLGRSISWLHMWGKLTEVVASQLAPA